ncbi:MAG TPA: hypothetical protein PKV75_07425 [Desulfobacterales bacterium]|nr:hypothetical protein [Desulfobacterales bacterium]
MVLKSSIGFTAKAAGEVQPKEYIYNILQMIPFGSELIAGNGDFIWKILVG